MADPVIFRTYATADAPGRSVGAQLNASTSAGIGAQAPIRRPLRGLIPKKDTYAQLCVLRYGGGAVRLYDQSAQNGTGEWVSSMLLQSVTFTRAERVQPFISFGAVHYMFFGEQPVTVSVAAVLLDSTNFEQVRDWWANYDGSLRGTILAENGARIVLTYGSYVIEGYMVSAGTTRSASDRSMEQLNFSIAVTNIAFHGNPGDTSTRQAFDTSAANQDRLLDGSVVQAHLDEVAARKLLQQKSANIANADTSAPSVVDRIRNFAAAVGGVVDTVRDRISDAQRAVEDFMLGRENSIPPGYEGELYSLTSAEVSELLQRERAQEKAMDLFRGEGIPGGYVSPTSIVTSAPAADQEKQAAYLRWDEYIENRPGGTVPGFQASDDGIRALQSFLQLADQLPNTREIIAAEATRRALIAYGREFPGWTVENGYERSAVIRALGTATYATVRIGAAMTGADALLAGIGSGVVNLPDDGGAASFDRALASAQARANGAEGAALTGEDARQLSLEQARRDFVQAQEMSPGEVRF